MWLSYCLLFLHCWVPIGHFQKVLSVIFSGSLSTLPSHTDPNLNLFGGSLQGKVFSGHCGAIAHMPSQRWWGHTQGLSKLKPDKIPVLVSQRSQPSVWCTIVASPTISMITALGDFACDALSMQHCLGTLIFCASFHFELYVLVLLWFCPHHSDGHLSWHPCEDPVALLSPLRATPTTWSRKNWILQVMTSE